MIALQIDKAFVLLDSHSRSFIRFYPTIVLTFAMLRLTRSQSVSVRFIRRLFGSHPTGTADSRLRRVVNSDRERRRQSRFIGIPTGTTNDS